MIKPSYLEDCDPHSRTFPASWKDAFWRLNGGISNEGYLCPGCNNRFRLSRGFAALHADHIKCVDDDGLTVWENMQLLCGPCNLKKSNKLLDQL